MTPTKEMLKPGFIIRDISEESDGECYDVLCITCDGFYRYSPDVFYSVHAARVYARLLKRETANIEAWDFYTWDQVSCGWKFIDHLPFPGEDHE